jgi:hypothetical protein
VIVKRGVPSQDVAEARLLSRAVVTSRWSSPPFAGLGADVTVIYRGEKILRGSDEDVRKHVRSEMEKAGMVLTGCIVTKVEKHGESFSAHLRWIERRRRSGDVRGRPPSERQRLGWRKPRRAQSGQWRHRRQ